MGGAVDMCSGLGACRKKLDGTMCPSYMATQEEADSTRGRANVLRLAMAGRIGEAGLGDDGVYDVLDLCLECRACKAECPVGVDMARFKSEFLADYWSRHGVSRHARDARARTHAGEVGKRLRAPVELGDEQRRRSKHVGEKWLGIDRRRALPDVRVADAGGAWRLGPTSAATAIRLQRHIHELLRSRDRHGRARRAPRGRRSRGSR